MGRFGTINMIKKINNEYRGFHVSKYNQLHDGKQLFFQYSFCWRVLNEFQACCKMLFNTFSGIIAQIGNAIIFKGNYQLFRSYISLKGAGSKRTALRSLYIVKDTDNEQADNHSYGHRLSLVINNKRKKKKKRKKVWIVCTHLDELNDESEKSNENEDRLQQIEQIHKWMVKAQEMICMAPIIICGDFNCTPDSKVYEFMKSKGYKSVV